MIPHNKTGILLGFPSPAPPSQFSDPPRPSTVASGRDVGSGGASILIISGIIAFVIVTSASIHILLRLISRSRSSSSSSSSSSLPSPTPLLRRLSSTSAANPPVNHSDILISSLPVFYFASSISTLRKSPSLDCAVCLSTFRPHDELRLLPACRHAFHSHCVDTWLRSTPSCPLCRSSIHNPPAPSSPSATNDSSRSRSFRVELGSVSLRTASIDANHTGGANQGRCYSLGSSFEYQVDEDFEAVLKRLRSPELVKIDKPDVGSSVSPAPSESTVAHASGESGRWWLRDYVDRLALSESSSFGSLRISGRFASQHFDLASATASGGGGQSWDFEANSFTPEWEDSKFGSFYRWLLGV